MNSDIRQCEEKFFVLPFQAIRIKIGNVQYDENKDKRQYELGIKLLQQSFRSKPLPAILQNVIADGEWIEVRVFDKNGDDIGEILVNEGYAKPKF